MWKSMCKGLSWFGIIWEPFWLYLLWMKQRVELWLLMLTKQSHSTDEMSWSVMSFLCAKTYPKMMLWYQRSNATVNDGCVGDSGKNDPRKRNKRQGIFPCVSLVDNTKNTLKRSRSGVSSLRRWSTGRNTIRASVTGCGRTQSRGSAAYSQRFKGN